jgi:hypothetical protein
MNTENNKNETNSLIAEFMGMVYDNHNEQPNKYWELTDEHNFVSHKPYPQDKDLKFHSDWNWLMEVVEKIESLDYDVKIFNSTVEITSYKDDFKTIFGYSDTYSKKEAVYNACIDFIKWYDKNAVKN